MLKSVWILVILLDVVMGELDCVSNETTVSGEGELSVVA